MTDNALTRAARDLTDDEAEILGNFARNIGSHDTAIRLQMSRQDVIKVIREKGLDNRAYADNLTKVRASLLNPVAAGVGMPPGEMAREVTAARGGTPVAQRPGRLDEDFIGPSSGLPGIPAALRASGASPGKKSVPAKKSAPVTAVVVEPAAPQPVDLEQLVDRLPVDAPPAQPEPDPVAEPEPEPAPAEPPVQPQPVAVAEPEPAPVQPPPAAAGEETYEQLLTRAEKCGNADLVRVAEGIRFEMERLSQALDVEVKAAVLRGQVTELDADIAERVARRDALRAELQKLLASDVMVSATSGSLRRPSPVGEPEASLVRAWAGKHGFEIAEHGKVPGGIVQAYKKAFGYAA